MPPHPSTNFEIQRYYQNDAHLISMNKPAVNQEQITYFRLSNMRLNGIYSKNNLPKIKDGTYVIRRSTNQIGTQCITMYVNGNNVTYFDSFGVEYIPKEIKKLIGNKSITTNIYSTGVTRI